MYTTIREEEKKDDIDHKIHNNTYIPEENCYTIEQRN